MFSANIVRTLFPDILTTFSASSFLFVPRMFS